MATEGMSLERAWNQNLEPVTSKEIPDLITVAHILLTYSDWQAVVTAIETHGLQGWDRYGRWGKFKPDQRPVSDALDAIAEVLKQWDLHGEAFNAHDWIEDHAGYHNLHAVGWAESDLPKFRDYVSALPKKPAVYRSTRRIEKNDLVLIAFLLRLILGEEGGCKHPQFSSEQDIKNYASDHLKGVPGLSERTLDTKFREAKRCWDQAD